MEALRVSATDIDMLRRFRNEDEAELPQLLAMLRRQAQQTEPMLAGSALHKALETASDGEFEKLEADGYTFTIRADGDLDLPSIREVKETETFAIEGCLVTLVGKADAVHGRRIEDHKLTSHFDADRFVSSMQWRIYLELFDADEFRWNIFEGTETEPRHYVIKAIHKLRMHRYPTMLDDVVNELREFVRFARCHLPERFERQAA